MTARISILANPNARGNAAARAAALATALGLHDIDATVTTTPDLAALDAACAALADDPPDAIVAVGGDGTARAVLGRLARIGRPIAIVAAGGGNFLARDLGLPADPGACAAGLAAALRGAPGEVRIVRLALGRAGPEPFALIAGVGLDGDAAQGIDPGLKRASSSLAYGAAILSAATAWSTARRPRLELELDGAPAEAAWVMLTNARFTPSRLDLGDGAPRFTAVLIDPRWPGDLAETLGRLAAGRLVAGGAVRLLPCRRLLLRGPQGLPVHADGDVVGATPITLEAVAAARVFARIR